MSGVAAKKGRTAAVAPPPLGGATVGIRALKQNASAVVAEVSAGRVITITDRGRPVAQLIPYAEDHIERLLASGRVKPASGSVADLPEPAPARAGEPSLTEVLSQMRDEERY